MTHSPSAYTEGYAKARLYDQSAADNYIRHTTVGDPVLDPIMEGALLAVSRRSAPLHLGPASSSRTRFCERRRSRCAISSKVLTRPPPWLDYDAFRPGVRAFHANVDLMLTAFVTGVLVEGFSTLIAKSFSITGRVASTKRRLQQNNRHMMDIFFPRGLGV